MTSVGLFEDLGDPKELDEAVRQRLVGSLEHIAERAGAHLKIDQDAFGRALARIRKERQHPGVFARYYDLIAAVTEGRLEDAQALVSEIVVAAEAGAPEFQVVPYTEERLGSDYERFPRLVFAEYSSTSPMVSPEEEQASAATRNLEEALRTISEVDPELREEIDALFIRIYLAARNTEPNSRGFGGVTSFLAWGASFMNIDHYNTPWSAAQYLVHEVTHALLFGLSLEEPLVWNSPEESYRSPLREDARPMDGIYHATLVCGRLARFNSAWLDSGLVSDADIEATRGSVTNNARLFRDGLDVINDSGKLSDLGRNLLDVSEKRLCPGV